MNERAIEAVLAELDSGREAALARLFEFLRIPSVSTQPTHAADCRKAALWAKELLEGMGFVAGLHETAGHPIVLAQHPGPGRDAPRVLFYGHYDVQPPEPLELWRNQPFAPTIEEHPSGPRIVARGAVDDKGQVMAFFEACRALAGQQGTLPVALTVLLEGEEECGSPNLESFLAAQRDALAADIVLVCDTNMWDRSTPAITTRLRGLVYTQIDVAGPSRDLHSGLYGGVALNPLNALTRALGDLHDDAGRVKLPGFYDAVRPPAPVERAGWAKLAHNEAAFLGEIGLSESSGEKEYGLLERLWARPSADINGIWGGYMGEGAKTVIPAEAHAKVSFRLVPDQDSQAVLDGFRAFLTARLPAQARLTIRSFGAAPGIALPTEQEALRAAKAALGPEFGREPVLIGSGASIPVVETMKRLMRLDTLLVGFGLDDDAIHSPNEKFDLACFTRGARALARLLARLGANPELRQR